MLRSIVRGSLALGVVLAGVTAGGATASATPSGYVNVGGQICSGSYCVQFFHGNGNTVSADTIGGQFYNNSGSSVTDQGYFLDLTTGAVVSSKCGNVTTGPGGTGVCTRDASGHRGHRVAVHVIVNGRDINPNNTNSYLVP